MKKLISQFILVFFVTCSFPDPNDDSMYLPTERNIKIENASVVVNSGKQNESLGVIIYYPQKMLSQYLLLAPSSAFNDNEQYFTISFTNLNTSPVHEWTLPKQRAIYRQFYELQNNEKYSVSCISLNVKKPLKNMPDEFTSYHQIFFADLVSNEIVQKELVSFLGIEYSDFDDVTKNMVDLLLAAIKKDY